MADRRGVGGACQADWSCAIVLWATPWFSWCSEAYESHIENRDYQHISPLHYAFDTFACLDNGDQLCEHEKNKRV